MKIINRIMISSAFLVLISLVSLLAVMGTVIYLLPSDPGKEILDDAVFAVGDIVKSFEATTEDWTALDGRLSRYGYNLYVLAEDNIVFPEQSSLPGEIVDSLTQLELEQGALAGQIQKLTFVAVPMGAYSLFAVEGTSYDTNDVGDFLQWFLVYGLIVVVIILLLSQLFTRKMIGLILCPLNALSEGAKRIENGDLSRPVAYAGKDEFASVCTAFNHMQESLLREREKTAAYERARTDLITGISHDLRTPLTSVKGYLKGLQDGVANTPEKQKQYLSIAYEKACDMDVLLQKLFYFSNLEMGRLPLLLSHEDLAGFARGFAESMRGDLNNRNIEMAVSATSVPHPVRIDPEQMRRVLLNLTENAIKYADAEPLVLSISIWYENGTEHLLFADNGRGVAEEHFERIFERFWRSDEARSTRNGESSGLGLYIVKYIVEAHGGTVTAENDNGLQIKISLPCGEEEKH